jgi:nifR3 family TIM-barrel protein
MQAQAGLCIGGIDLGRGVILAPMAGVTDVSFRSITKSFGADLVTSEMISAEGLVRRNPSTRLLLATVPEERPLAIQIFGADSRVLAEAGRVVADAGADLIDINMGCPVPKVLRQEAGAALLRDPDRVKRVVDAVRRAVEIPVTVKIRSGWSSAEINAVQVARAAEAAGADAITVHPRTADQRFSRAADWRLIARVKQAVSIPVIGNGDIIRPEQVWEMRRLSGCDGVMIGRASMGNPWIFRQADELAAGRPVSVPTGNERLAVARRHLFLSDEWGGSRRSGAYYRSRLMWYTKRLAGGARLRAALSRTGKPEDMLHICETFFQQLDPEPENLKAGPAGRIGPDGSVPGGQGRLPNGESSWSGRPRTQAREGE